MLIGQNSVKMKKLSSFFSCSCSTSFRAKICRAFWHSVSGGPEGLFLFYQYNLHCLRLNSSSCSCCSSSSREFLGKITLQRKKEREKRWTDFYGWFIDRTEYHLEPSVRHRSALYVHHLVDFHTWELPSTADLLRVVETSHGITHSLSKLLTFLANSAHQQPPDLRSCFWCLFVSSAAVWWTSAFTLTDCGCGTCSLVTRVTFWSCQLLFFSVALALFINEINCGAKTVFCSAKKNPIYYPRYEQITCLAWHLRQQQGDVQSLVGSLFCYQLIATVLSHHEDIFDNN